MRFSRLLFLPLFLFLLPGCIASQQNINVNAAAAIEVEEEQDNGILCLIKPANGHISSPFGQRRGTRNNKPRYHGGIDIAAPRGSSVVAAAEGTVVFSGRKSGYGKTVKICHGNDRRTLYAHMDRVFVAKGQALAQGERIGLVGRTGRTTGPHLHFELHVDGKRTNPIPENGWTVPVLEIVTAAGPPPGILTGAIAPPVATAPANAATVAETAPPAAKKPTASKQAKTEEKAGPPNKAVQAGKKRSKQPAS